jgi:hypothetical protein
MQLDTRREDRRRVAIPVDWCAVGASTRTRSIAEDISEDGLFVRTALPLRPGTRVDLLLRLKKGTLAAVGVVRWASEQLGMGLSIQPA